MPERHDAPNPLEDPGSVGHLLEGMGVLTDTSRSLELALLSTFLPATPQSLAAAVISNGETGVIPLFDEVENAPGVDSAWLRRLKHALENLRSRLSATTGSEHQNVGYTDNLSAIPLAVRMLKAASGTEPLMGGPQVAAQEIPLLRALLSRVTRAPAQTDGGEATAKAQASIATRLHEINTGMSQSTSTPVKVATSSNAAFAGYEQARAVPSPKISPETTSSGISAGRLKEILPQLTGLSDQEVAKKFGGTPDNLVLPPVINGMAQFALGQRGAGIQSFEIGTWGHYPQTVEDWPSGAYPNCMLTIDPIMKDGSQLPLYWTQYDREGKIIAYEDRPDNLGLGDLTPEDMVPLLELYVNGERQKHLATKTDPEPFAQGSSNDADGLAFQPSRTSAELASKLDLSQKPEIFDDFMGLLLARIKEVSNGTSKNTNAYYRLSVLYEEPMSRMHMPHRADPATAAAFLEKNVLPNVRRNAKDNEWYRQSRKYREKLPAMEHVIEFLRSGKTMAEFFQYAENNPPDMQGIYPPSYH